MDIGLDSPLAGFWLRIQPAGDRIGTEWKMDECDIRNNSGRLVSLIKGEYLVY